MPFVRFVVQTKPEPTLNFFRLSVLSVVKKWLGSPVLSFVIFASFAVNLSRGLASGRNLVPSGS